MNEYDNLKRQRFTVEARQRFNVDKEVKYRASELFHRLWGQSKDGQYDKQTWGELQIILQDLGVITDPNRVKRERE